MTFKKACSILLNRRQCGLYHSDFIVIFKRKITYLRMMVRNKNLYELEVSPSCVIEHSPITEISTLFV